MFCCVAAFRVESLFSFAFQSFPILLQVFRKKWHTICQQNVASPSVLAVTEIDVGGEGRGVTAAPSKINCKLAQVSGVYGRRDRPAGASEKFFYYKSRQNIANAANVNRKPRQSNAPKMKFSRLQCPVIATTNKWGSLARYKYKETNYKRLM